MQGRSWFRKNFYALFVWALCVPGLLVPNYLLRIGHNPPAGVYIAVVGGLAAYVTFREGLRSAEKAAWIVLITLFVVAEIRTLYIADAEQVAKFGNISDALDATKRGLDTTAKGIDATARALDKSMTSSHEQFAATMGRTNAVLTSITGGNSYGAVVPMLANLSPGQEVPLAVENHGVHILTGVSVTLYDTGVWMGFTHNSILRSVGSRINVDTLHPRERLVLNTQIRPEQYMPLDDKKRQFRVFVFVAAQNFTSSEFLDFRKESTNLWMYRYKIYRQNTTADIVRAAKKKHALKERFLEGVDWSSDPNWPVPMKSAIPDWD